MRMFGNNKHLLPGTLLIISAFLAIFLAACSGSVQAGSAAATSAIANVPVQNLSFQTSIDLKHSPIGTVDLSWNADSKELKVKVAATGLAPNSTHPEHIHAGTCASNPMGAIVYTLNPLVADAHGVAASETTIAHVENGIPGAGWYVNIHNGPTLNSALEAGPIACANVEKKGDGPVRLALSGTIAPDEAVHGSARIQIDVNKVVVTLTLRGLVPNSTHIAHIHAGSCESQGAVVYPLKPVTADAKGNATTSTTISIANIQEFRSAQLYINVHEAGTMSGMSKQQGFDPITCGNIADHI